MSSFMQLVVSGLALGSVYALIAMGFVLIYKSTGVINFAQGELMMIGAYVCFALIVQFHIPFLPAFLITLVFCAVLGFAIELFVLRPMIGEPLFAVIMVTIGLSSVLRGVVGQIWGHEEHPFPPVFPGEPVSFFGVVILPVHIWTILFTVVLVTIFFLFFKYARTGIAMRATAIDQDVAFLMGISVRKIFALSWVIACVIALVGGIFLGVISFMHSGMGYIGLRAFPAAVLGGLDSIGGAVLGGFIIGVIENLAGGYLDHLFGGGIKEITAFIVLLIIMMIRPYGLFGTEEIERV